MGLITEAPADLPSTNALDYIEDPDEQHEPEGVRTEVYLSGAHVHTLDYAPRGLERMTFMVDVEVYEAGGVRFTGEDGETRMPICKVRRIGDMYLPGTTRPPSKEEIAAEKAREKARTAAEQAERDEAERAEREHNEPPMFDERGEPNDDVIDDEDPGDNVVQFSDGSKP